MALTDNLVAYWKLDEASGSREDSVGANTLIDNNTVTSAAGKIGTAASFSSASSEYLSCAHNSALTTGSNFTFACWINATTFPSYPIIASKGWDGGTPNREWILYHREDTNRLQFSVASDVGSTSLNATEAISIGTWYFVVVWYDSAWPLIGLQVNDRTPDTTECPQGVHNGTNPFWIGASPIQSLYWNGLVDEAGLWKRVLTPAERTELYNGGAGLTYPFIFIEPPVFTELYCRSADGSNLNSGSTNTASLTREYASGSWVSATRVFTVASGNPLTDGVVVDDLVSVYANGSTVTGFVGFVTARDATTITIHATRSCGTSPADGTGNRTLRVGGAWKGPNAGVGFPWDFVGVTLSNSAGLTPRVSFIGTFATTGSFSHTLTGPVTFQGATAVAGDGGKATILGSPTGTAYNVLVVTGILTHLTDLIFQGNGSTGWQHGVLYQSGSTNSIIRRCTFADMWGCGLRVSDNNTTLIEVLAYNCDRDNDGQTGAIHMAGTGRAIRCVARDNPGSNVDGFVITQAGELKDCIATRNGGSGVLMGVFTSYNVTILGLDSYNNGGDGLRTPFDYALRQSVYIENSNFLRNGGWGIKLPAGPPGVYSGVITNCGFGSGTERNISGTISNPSSIERIGSVTYPADKTPWADPANNDFSIVLPEAQGTGRGIFPIPTAGHPDIGAAQHEGGGGGGGEPRRAR